MSYNIDSIEVVASDGFRISYDALGALARRVRKDVRPEASVFDKLEDREGGPADLVEFYEPAKGDFWWYGEGSGWAFETLRDVVLPAFEGSADLVLTWEGGDSHSGLRLRSGKVTEHEVALTLGPERTARR